MTENRIARIKSIFLEDDATSLNGRQYPAKTVNRLVQAASEQLADPNALPLTVYLSHDSAYMDATNEIVGKIAAIGKEGTQAFALIDVPDTQAGREVVNLVKGGYIKSQSLRAINAEMYIDNNEPYPMVGGENIRLTGIDFTSSPGIPNARVEYVSESKEPQDVREVFAFKDTALIEEIKGSNEALYPQSLNTTHDYLACAIGLECAPDKMERADALKFLGITEVGAKFSAKTLEYLANAHSGLAAYLGKECKESTGDKSAPPETEQPMTPEERAQLLKELQEAFTQQQALNQQKEAEKHPPQGGDATIPVQAKPTAEDALKLLQEAGYTVAAPKTQEQLMQETLDAKFTEMQTSFETKLTEMQQKLNPRYAPQRKSMVEGSNAEDKPVKKPYYRNGDYMKEQLRDYNTHLQLLDRSRPKPEWYNAERDLKELEVQLMGWMDAQHSFDGNVQIGEL
ncbi:MAG TPA: hypothetical protein VHV10_02365 [Ktedonobacteraceae bacterium]|jgi:hypothetical protein|nr:hypothetical protein [Ktedonobacteraceae bacterium]